MVAQCDHFTYDANVIEFMVTSYGSFLWRYGMWVWFHWFPKRRRAMPVATAGRIFQVREGKSIKRFVCYFYYYMNKKSQERVMAWPLQVDAVCIHDKCYCVFAEGDERRTSCNHAFMKTDPYCCTRWTLVKLVVVKVMFFLQELPRELRQRRLRHGGQLPPRAKGFLGKPDLKKTEIMLHKPIFWTKLSI